MRDMERTSFKDANEVHEYYRSKNLPFFVERATTDLGALVVQQGIVLSNLLLELKVSNLLPYVESVSHIDVMRDEQIYESDPRFYCKELFDLQVTLASIVLTTRWRNEDDLRADEAMAIKASENGFLLGVFIEK